MYLVPSTPNLGNKRIYVLVLLGTRSDVLGTRIMFDTHCHLNFKDFKNDADEIIRQSLDQGISLIIVGSQSTTSQRAVEYAARYDSRVYAAVGLHPVHLYAQDYDDGEASFASRAEEFDVSFYRSLAQSDRVVAIGEMGIDYFHWPADVPQNEVKQKQRDVLINGIELARELDIPIILHTRPSKGTYDAYDDLYELLKEVDYPKCQLHCFLANESYIDKFLELGVMISFTGIVTFKNAPDIQAAAAKVPLERMLIETDAPYLSPEPFRGKRNNPLNVQYIVEKIATLKHASVEEVISITDQNARSFFNIT